MTPIAIVVHQSLSAWQPEIEFVLRTLATLAGYPVRFAWNADGPQTADLYYGPAIDGVRPAAWIPSAGRAFTEAPTITAGTLTVSGHRARLALDGVRTDARGISAPLVFEDDIVLVSYWLLTGAREPFAPRSRAGDLDLSDSPLVRDGALDVPLVSMWAAELRAHFRTHGREPKPAPWAPDGRAAFAFTHDVDYPEIIPWIETPRQLAQGRPGLAWRTATGRNHHWTFDEWITFEAELGARPCFYFMARQGSLLQYALGTPDDFYDVRTIRFARLFGTLRDAGAEIGLHASFNAYRDVAVFREEISRLKAASAGAVHGNRHHYWHLDPHDPNTTLARHAEAGLEYDSSLGLEYYPGFRRGICHPFRPFDPVRRRAIDTIQLPPAWMDDHFDRRIAKNGITNPDAVARGLVAAAARTGGVVIVDYHSRGMNRDVYPRWGAWLEKFARTELAGNVVFHRPCDIAAMYRTYESELADLS